MRIFHRLSDFHGLVCRLVSVMTHLQAAAFALYCVFICVLSVGPEVKFEHCYSQKIGAKVVQNLLHYH